MSAEVEVTLDAIRALRDLALDDEDGNQTVFLTAALGLAERLDQIVRLLESEGKSR